MTQAKAVQAAPREEQVRHRERLALYQRGTAYREPHRRPPRPQAPRSVLQP